MRFGWSPKDASARIRLMAKIAAVLSIAIYIFVYLKEPFSDLWNGILVNLFLVIAASFAAAMATMIWSRYDETDSPRHIWLHFAIGLWVWVIAEIVYGYLDVTQDHQVSIGLPDVFWVAAYVFFAYALFVQYRLLANQNKQELLNRVSLAALLVIVLYSLTYIVLIVWIHPTSQLDAAVNAFYPVGDLFLGAVAVWMILHFQGGVFARPWLGLLAFSVTDFLYAWIDTSGIYDQANSVWTALFDTAYMGAYLILALGLLSQWAFLKYGLLSSSSKK